MRIALLIGARTEAAPVLVLDVPSDFHEVPLDRNVEERTASQLGVLDEMGIEDRRQREALSLYLEALSVRLRSGNVVGTAFCAVQLDGSPSTATLTVAMQPLSAPDPGVALLGAAEAMRRQDRFDDVQVERLGSYDVVMAQTDRPNVPGTPAGGDVAEALRELSVFVPLPGHDTALTVTLATPCLEDWDVYRQLLVDVCRTLKVERTHPDFIR